MLGPTLFFLAVFILWPIFETFRLSLFDWNGLTPTQEFICFGNYKELISDLIFWRSVKNSFILLGMALIIEIPLGFFLALMLYTGGKRFKIFRFLYFFPMLLSPVAVGILFKFIFDYNSGALNQIIGILNQENLMQDWLGNKEIAIYTIGILVTWQYTPFYMLLFLAALNNIPTEIEEAAKIDGARGWKMIRQIQIPLVRGAGVIAVILISIGSLRYFDLVWVLTAGGPESSTEVMATYLFQMAFKSYRVGYASTIATALFIIAFFTAIFVQFSTRKIRQE
jgi:raffinose/stachyose/melibiose transport system permease protein